MQRPKISKEFKEEIKAILTNFYSDNANIRRSPSGKMLAVGSATSTAVALDEMTKEFSDAHNSKDIHIHDLDFYYKTLTCIQVPVRKLLGNGFNTGNGTIRTPQRFAVASQQIAIMLQSEQNDQFGGVGLINLDSDLAPEVAKERERIKASKIKDFKEMGVKRIKEDVLNKLVAEDLNDVIYQGMEGFIHNLNTMHSRAGAQVPFTSINLGVDTSEDGRLVAINFLKAFRKGLGKGETPIFPQVIYKVKKGINYEPDAPNRDIFELAVQVASEKLNPTFLLCDSSFNKRFDPKKIGTMGCRTRVAENINGEEGAEARGNLSFTSVNLPRIAMQSLKNSFGKADALDKFFEELDSKVDLAIRQLLERYGVQCQLKVKDLPFMMGQELYMGSENLDWDDSIEPAIKHGTLSVGFIGLAETLILLTGKHHGESEESLKLGIEIVRRMRDQIDRVKVAKSLNFSLLGTPAEGLSHKFTEKDVVRFGEIERVTDKGFYTNSFHVPVDYKISAFKKLEIEGIFHKYCNAGHISYVEFEESPKSNPQAMFELIDCAMESDIGYMGYNYPDDYCCECGCHGVMDTTCNKCGSENLKHIRRVTGYLGYTEDFTKGKTKELAKRVNHVK